MPPHGRRKDVHGLATRRGVARHGRALVPRAAAEAVRARLALPAFAPRSPSVPLAPTTRARRLAPATSGGSRRPAGAATTRTIPAVALVVGSATMLPIAASLRTARERRAAPGGSTQPDVPARRRRGSRFARRSCPRAAAFEHGHGARSSRAPTELAKVDWHHATSVGLPYDGPPDRRHAASRRGPRLGHVEPGHRQRPEPAAPAVRQRAHDPRRSSR